MSAGLLHQTPPTAAHTTLTLYIYTPFMTDILVCAQQLIHLCIYVMCLLYKALYFSLFTEVKVFFGGW